MSDSPPSPQRVAATGSTPIRSQEPPQTQRIDYEGETYEIPTWASLEEYRRLDREMPFPIEFLDGEVWVKDVYAMSGASIAHYLIGPNLSGELRETLKGTDCNVLSGSQKIQPPKPSRHCYPDLAVVCGTPEIADDETHGLTNPTLIVEVLSPSTAGRDLGVKYNAYITIPSLREYVVIHQNAAVVQRYVREGEKWMHHTTVGLDAVVQFAAVPAAVSMAEIYRGVPIVPSSPSEP